MEQLFGGTVMVVVTVMTMRMVVMLMTVMMIVSVWKCLLPDYRL